ncbi:hypothetical protein, partial [Corynebacterium parakroppenstedtii]|uniref:hypothetical protein n=1 Tax=Corynebacterium parakroppenstedtii TaxID=2828363 RepID=UPI001F288BEB
PWPSCQTRSWILSRKQNSSFLIAPSGDRKKGVGQQQLVQPLTCLLRQAHGSTKAVALREVAHDAIKRVQLLAGAGKHLVTADTAACVGAGVAALGKRRYGKPIPEPTSAPLSGQWVIARNDKFRLGTDAPIHGVFNLRAQRARHPGNLEHTGDHGGAAVDGGPRGGGGRLFNRRRVNARIHSRFSLDIDHHRTRPAGPARCKTSFVFPNELSDASAHNFPASHPSLQPSTFTSTPIR